MRRRLVISLLTVFSALWPLGLLFAQEQAAAGGEGEEQVGEQQVDMSKIEQIFEEERELHRGGVFFYNPAGRRDPFVSLLRGAPTEGQPTQRPEGLAGVLIDELRVEGVMKTPSGFIAFIQDEGREGRYSYIIKPGSKLFDGEVKEITLDRVVFLKRNDDPNALTPYIEVVRDLGEK